MSINTREQLSESESHGYPLFYFTSKASQHLVLIEEWLIDP